MIDIVVHMTHPDWQRDSQKRLWLRGVPIFESATLGAEHSQTS